MSDNNRNRSSSYNSDENWNQQQEGRYDQQQHNQFGQQYRNQRGNVNYDRDNDRDRNRNQDRDYGSVSYGGSSYGYAGSNQQSSGNFGAGYSDDYNEYNQGNSYGSSYNRNQGQQGGQWGQSGQHNQQGQYGRRDRDDYTSNYGNQDRNYSGGYDSSANYGSNYGGSGGYGNSGNYGGNQNYGNAQSGYSGRNYGTYEPNRGNSGNQHDDRNWWDKTRDEVSSWFGDEDAERRRRRDQVASGAHRGKGPRDYRRSDERILEDVCDRLSDDSFIDASEIDVKVSGSEVVLTGSVDSREAKRRAEDLAESISGVTNVQNNLKVSGRNEPGGLRSSGDSKSYRE